MERYRPNIVIRTIAPGFTENDWAGHDLRIGRELTLRVMSRTPRCAIPTLEHGDLPRDTAALRVLADHNRVTPVEPLAPQPCAGAYAQVLHPAASTMGDVVRLADGYADEDARQIPASSQVRSWRSSSNMTIPRGASVKVTGVWMGITDRSLPF